MNIIDANYLIANERNKNCPFIFFNIRCNQIKKKNNKRMIDKVEHEK